MVTVTCQELGGGNCQLPIAGNNLEELRRNLLIHAQKTHREMIQRMSPQDQQSLMQKLETLYRQKALVAAQ